MLVNSSLILYIDTIIALDELWHVIHIIEFWCTELTLYRVLILDALAIEYGITIAFKLSFALAKLIKTYGFSNYFYVYYSIKWYGGYKKF